MNTYSNIVRELREHRGTPEKVNVLSGFFKTGKGQYAEGDQFLGVRVPDQRRIAKKYFREADFGDVEKLLVSPWHECRLTGLLLLVYRFEKSGEEERKKIYHFYIEHLKAVNNWDLVDTTVPNILGEYMRTHPKEKTKLLAWAKSKNLWERRVAILVTYAFIKQEVYEDTIRLAKILLHDEHDLIRKAVGWMLREVGKRDEKILCDFLDVHARVMPRTMLRYAIERLEEKKKKKYMHI